MTFDEEPLSPHGECQQEIIRLQTALTPFIAAWQFAREHDRALHLNLAQLAALAFGQLSAADFQRAERTTFNS